MKRIRVPKKVIAPEVKDTVEKTEPLVRPINIVLDKIGPINKPEVDDVPVITAEIEVEAEREDS